MTTTDYVVRYQEHVSSKSYEELVAGFENAVADAESGQFAQAFRAAASSENGRETWEATLKPLLGPNDFMHVFTADFGTLLGWYDVPAKARTWIYGNPIIATSMAEQDIRVAGRVPLQILIYEAEDGSARIAYDLPSSVVNPFGDPEVETVARELDKKVVGFLTELAGAEA